ncbi:MULTISPECIES: hypothetical protein [unclassified Streptomyces]|uniref:hypothetical protein n=1 Tax=unclassified Streptomyces TaxID=2593676 RepID=UPI0022572AE0|nr:MULTISPECIES: hypothetical protein [unclassified Streptomyces]MCX4524915.1 hypothetical protein [Streptomyces sp. NBC_01551]MCX4544573.1 hypothetical protein [Streptomyces sp. NBC_01565]
MHAYTLASVAVPVTAALYGLAGVLRCRTAVRRRRALRRWAVVLADPYQAVMDRWWPYDTTQAAAARLVLDGLVTVNHRGNLRPSPAASDPARIPGHPLPEALLAALLRRTAPATLGNIVERDAGFEAARREFRAARPALLRVGEPARPAMFGLYLVLAEMLFCAAGLMSLRPDGDAEWTAAWAAWTALIAQVIWFPVYPRARGAGWTADADVAEAARLTHPALATLEARDPEALRRLGVSRVRTRRGRNRGRPRRRRTPAESSVPAAQ